MTDTSILTGPTPADADAGAPVLPPVDEETEGTDDRRRLLIVAGVVGLLVLVIVAYLVLKGGGSSGSSSAGTVPRGTPAATSAPASSGGTTGATGHGAGSATSAGKAGTVLPKHSKTKLGRDPFVPLVRDDTVAAGAAPAATTTVASAPTSAPGAVPTSPASGGAPSASAGSPHAIRLLSIHGDKSAVFDVYYAHHKVYRFRVVAPDANSARGTEFAQDFALLGIQGSAVTIQVGDATPFDLRRGVVRKV